jgi:hypothetical protein
MLLLRDEKRAPGGPGYAVDEDLACRRPCGASGGLRRAHALPPLAPQSGGYTEERLSENQYRVVFTGNEHTAPALVEQFLLRRAAELHAQAGYDWFRPTNRVVEGRIRTIQTSRGKVRVSEGRLQQLGQLRRFLHAPRAAACSSPSGADQSAVGEAVEASAEIVLGRAPVPQVEGALDARQLLQTLASERTTR